MNTPATMKPTKAGSNHGRLHDGDFRADKRRSDQYAEHIKQILGTCFITESAEHEDQAEATDYGVERLAFAARRYDLVEGIYRPHDLTIRTERDWRFGKNPTETHKIFVLKHASHYIFVWAGRRRGRLAAWAVLDLDVWRANRWNDHVREVRNMPIGGTRFDVHELPAMVKAVPKILVACSRGLLAPKRRCKCATCLRARGLDAKWRGHWMYVDGVRQVEGSRWHFKTQTDEPL